MTSPVEEVIGVNLNRDFCPKLRRSPMCDNNLGQPAPAPSTPANPADEIQLDFGPAMSRPDLGPVVIPPDDPGQVWTMARRPLCESAVASLSSESAVPAGDTEEALRPHSRRSGRVHRFCTDKTGQFIED